MNALLFAYREIPHENLGFPSFELLYGRSVRSPMIILKELWTKEIPDEETKSTYQYILDLRERLEETCNIAQQQLKKERKHQRKHYNKRTRDRQMKEGENVLDFFPYEVEQTPDAMERTIHHCTEHLTDGLQS